MCRDVLDVGDVGGGEGRGAVDVNALLLARRPPAHGDVDVCAISTPEVVKRCRRTVRDHCAFATGKHRRGETAVAGQELRWSQ